MKAKFEIRMTNQDMYNFLMYHSYHGFTGIFSIAAGIALLAYFFWCAGTGRENSFLYPLFGVLFLVYQPWTLFISSAKQVSSNPVFQKPIGLQSVRMDRQMRLAGTVCAVSGRIKEVFLSIREQKMRASGRKSSSEARPQR